jgi:hypothetical protein
MGVGALAAASTSAALESEGVAPCWRHVSGTGVRARRRAVEVAKPAKTKVMKRLSGKHLASQLANDLAS